MSFNFPLWVVNLVTRFGVSRWVFEPELAEKERDEEYLEALLRGWEYRVEAYDQICKDMLEDCGFEP